MCVTALALLPHHADAARAGAAPLPGTTPSPSPSPSPRSDSPTTPQHQPSPSDSGTSPSLPPGWSKLGAAAAAPPAASPLGARWPWVSPSPKQYATVLDEDTPTKEERDQWARDKSSGRLQRHHAPAAVTPSPLPKPLARELNFDAPSSPTQPNGPYDFCPSQEE
jgi:hypothetical protein